MRWRQGTLVGLAVLLTTCQPTSADRNTVRRWLLCEECSEGELGAVVALGDRVTSVLGEALKGPPSSGRQNIRRQAEAMFDRIAGAQLSQSQYVEHFLDNYVATYQSRSIVALKRIGTPQAHAILIAALQSDSTYRYDVLRQLGEAAQVSLTRFAGAAQSAPLDSFVRVNPTLLIRDSTTGQPVPNVRVVFRPDSGGGRVADSLTRTNQNGLASVRWQLGDTDSSNVLLAEAAGRTVRFRAAGHGPTPRIVFVSQPGNGTVGHPLTPEVRIAILDAWGQRVTTFNGNAVVSMHGTGLHLIRPVVAGEAILTGLTPPAAGTGFRLSVALLGATGAVSEPFNVAP